MSEYEANWLSFYIFIAVIILFIIIKRRIKEELKARKIVRIRKRVKELEERESKND